MALFYCGLKNGTAVFVGNFQKTMSDFISICSVFLEIPDVCCFWNGTIFQEGIFAHDWKVRKIKV